MTSSFNFQGLVEVEITGDSRDIENSLRVLYNAFEDEAIAVGFLEGMVDPILRRRIEDRFASEGDSVSGPWLPLSEATVAIRGSAHPINVRTGAMKDELTSGQPRIETHSLGATMWLPGATTADVAAKISVAQAGGTTPDGRQVPARPVLGVDETDLELILVALGQYFEAHQLAAGLL